MAPTVLIHVDGSLHAALARQLGAGATAFMVSLALDTAAVARSLGVRVRLLHGPGAPATLLAEQAPDLEHAPLAGERGADLAAALGAALADGAPALLIGADLPHLPAARLRDALCHLAHGADMVVGPGDRGDWYLLGLGQPEPELLRALPGAGEGLDKLSRAARGVGRLVALPPWFGVRSSEDLALLAEALRTMPAHVAPQTRARLGVSVARARAVGG
jgi:glycosyltransferase A (GT-A) superfamily protein (DUF2064 family)